MTLVVIGGVAAGLSAAARARRIDASLEIVVLEKGAQISWAACGLPYFVEGRVQALEELIVYTPERFERERHIRVRTRAEVVAISHPRRELVLAGGERIRYDRLVVATGARPKLEGIAGLPQPNAFTLHTLEDARRLREFLKANRPRRAVVVGAGYIGLEAVEALRTQGLSVTLLDAGGTIAGREDNFLVRAVSQHLERFRVSYVPHQPVRAVEPDRVAGFPCDLVVLATGLKPNVELAQEAGIEIGPTGAIRVSERMETNLAGVYAAGDCAETTHLVTGSPVWQPLGTTANKMGRVAGANAAGRRERFPGIAGTAIVRLCGLAIGFTGLSAARARAAGFDAVAATITAGDRPRYFGGRPTQIELVADRRTGRLLGGAVIGEEGVAGRVNTLAAALSRAMTVEEFQFLDLAYAPPFAPVWDPLLIAAQQLLREL
jgi:NADPH-dependent 2,4-dienoyl-CoA reductase/sulfur reductase-like enzyme